MVASSETRPESRFWAAWGDLPRANLLKHRSRFEFERAKCVARGEVV